MKTIKTNLASDGCAHITLYGKEIVISKDNFDENGKARLSQFGESYTVEAVQLAKKQNTHERTKAILEKGRNRK